MSESRFENARTAILTKFRTITKANGYRNDIANVVPAIRWQQNITAFPEIGVEFGDSVLPGDRMDSARTVYDEIVRVYVAGFVKSDTETATDPENISKLFEKLESLIHDLKICITKEILTAYVASATNKWNVELSENKLTFTRDRIGKNGTIGVTVTEFNIRIRGQDNTFS